MARAQLYTVLIVEDQPLLALDLQSTLEAAGYWVAGSSRTVAGVKGMIEGRRPDVVLLDIVLEAQPDFELADLLASHGIPFLFVTCYDPSCIPERHAQRPILVRPCTPEKLLSELKRTVQSSVEPDRRDPTSSADPTAIILSPERPASVNRRLGQG
jgi:DNA-binding NtrC family response regulator